MQLRKIMPLLVIALLVIASSAISAAALAQDKDKISGKYTGIAKSEAMAKAAVKLYSL